MTNRRWTPAEDATLIREWPTSKSIDEIANGLQRSFRAAENRIKELRKRGVKIAHRSAHTARDFYGNKGISAGLLMQLADTGRLPTTRDVDNSHAHVLVHRLRRAGFKVETLRARGYSMSREEIARLRESDFYGRIRGNTINGRGIVVALSSQTYDAFKALCVDENVSLAEMATRVFEAGLNEMLG